MRRDALAKEAEEKGVGSAAAKTNVVNADGLVIKGPGESRVDVKYRFQKDANLRDMYTDAKSQVLVGKLLEDLDALAGNIAFFHTQDDCPTTSPLSLVTASVDEILFNPSNALGINRDYVLCGQVCYVGRSSLDVLVEVHALESSSGQQKPMLSSAASDATRVLSSVFTYVARDKATNRSARVNPLVLDEGNSTKEEREFQQKREKAAEERKSSKPASEAMSEAHLEALVSQGCALIDMPALAHPNTILMSSTELESCFLCHPQNSNPGGRVFGGFLIHRAFDLAAASCFLFAGRQGKLHCVDRVLFAKPVSIGDLVRLKSRVVCTSSSLVNIEVTCQIVRPEKSSSIISNKFGFVFGFDPQASAEEGKSGAVLNLRTPLPRNFDEAQIISTAQRRLDAYIARFS